MSESSNPPLRLLYLSPPAQRAQCSVGAEPVVIRASDRDLQPAVIRQPVKPGAEARLDVAALWIGLASVVAHEKEEWLSHGFADDATPGSPVPVDAAALHRESS
jgi:hypothetical protein